MVAAGVGAGPQKKTKVMNDEKTLRSAAPQGLLYETISLSKIWQDLRIGAHDSYTLI